MSRRPAALVVVAVSVLCLAAGAGDRWRAVTTGNTPELAANEIQFLKVIHDELWIGTLSGLTRYNDNGYAVVSKTTREKRRNPDTGEWETVDTVAKAELRVCTVFRPDARTCLVGAAGGLFTMDGLVLGDVALKGRTVAPVVPFNDTLWALAKNDGTGRSTLYHRAGTTWKPVEAFAETALADLVRTHDGRLWVVVDGDGVFEVDPGKGLDKRVHHLAGLNVRSVLLDARGRVWCGLWGRGVAVMGKDGTWTMHIENEKSAVLNLAADAAGHVWAGTSSGGLYEYDGKTWSRHFVDEGAVSLLYADSKGRLWVSTQSTGDLRYHHQGEWHRSLDNRLPMTSMAEYNGAIWAGGVLDGIHILQE